jgi:putative acetyltransferase
MAKPLAKAGLRPFLPADTALLAEIFRASIEELTGDDYSEAQQGAWAASADDEAAFGKRLAAGLTLVATIAGAPVGFVALKGSDSIDLLYVHPGAARQGVATLLCNAIEQLAKARGATRLTVDASDTAEPFFRQRGFAAQQRNTVVVGDEWLGNTTMHKTLAGAEGPDA